jgi:hypothetical protein
VCISRLKYIGLILARNALMHLRADGVAHLIERTLSRFAAADDIPFQAMGEPQIYRIVERVNCDSLLQRSYIKKDLYALSSTQYF